MTKFSRWSDARSLALAMESMLRKGNYLRIMELDIAKAGKFIRHHQFTTFFFVSALLPNRRMEKKEERGKVFPSLLLFFHIIFMHAWLPSSTSSSSCYYSSANKRQRLTLQLKAINLSCLWISLFYYSLLFSLSPSHTLCVTINFTLPPNVFTWRSFLVWLLEVFPSTCDF